MKRFLKKLVFALLIAVLPLQGYAASLSSLLCSSSSAIEKAVPVINTVAGNEVTLHEHNDSGSSSNDSHAGHLSCQQLSSALLNVAVTVCASDLSVFVPTIFVLPSLFFPEQPQRPPL